MEVGFVEPYSPSWEKFHYASHFPTKDATTKAQEPLD